MKFIGPGLKENRGTEERAYVKKKGNKEDGTATEERGNNATPQAWPLEMIPINFARGWQNWVRRKE